MMFKEKLGCSLRRFRETFKLNQREVSRALGVPYQSYQAYEYGKSVPSAEIIFKLADAYNVSADYLLGRSDMPRPLNFDEQEVKDAFAAREELRQLRNILSPQMNQAGQVAAQ